MHLPLLTCLCPAFVHSGLRDWAGPSGERAVFGVWNWPPCTWPASSPPLSCSYTLWWSTPHPRPAQATEWPCSALSSCLPLPGRQTDIIQTHGSFIIHSNNLECSGDEHSSGSAVLVLVPALPLSSEHTGLTCLDLSALSVNGG